MIFKQSNVLRSLQVVDLNVDLFEKTNLLDFDPKNSLFSSV